MECAVEYDGLRHRWVRRWAKSRIRDEQVRLYLSHGQTVSVVLMTCCLRADCFLSSSAIRDSSVDAHGARERETDRHVHHNTPLPIRAVLMTHGSRQDDYLDTGSSHLPVVSRYGVGVVRRRVGGAVGVGGANCERGR